jgi:hypothetical protein
MQNNMRQETLMIRPASLHWRRAQRTVCFLALTTMVNLAQSQQSTPRGGECQLWRAKSRWKLSIRRYIRTTANVSGTSGVMSWSAGYHTS